MTLTGRYMFQLMKTGTRFQQCSCYKS